MHKVSIQKGKKIYTACGIAHFEKAGSFSTTLDRFVTCLLCLEHMDRATDRRAAIKATKWHTNLHTFLLNLIER